MTHLTSIILGDNSSKPKDYLIGIQKLLNKIADKSLRCLADEGVFVFPEIVEDAKDLSLENIVIKSIKNDYHTYNIMGFIGLDNEQLTIKSRFSPSDEKKDYFLAYLLNRVLDVPNIVNLETYANENFQSFDFLQFVFPYYLKKSLRKNLFMSYVCHQYNDSNVKGVIDLERHINKNIPFIGRIAYKKRELSYDNNLMELVRHTIEFIKVQPHGNKILNNVSAEIRRVINATPSYNFYNRTYIIQANQKNNVRHAYFYEYRTLQRLCLLILKHQKHSIGDGVNQIHGILFDGAWLWEEYINSLIEDVFFHPQNKVNKDVQSLFSTEDNLEKGLIYPDFISKNIQARIIADAKYKPLKNISYRNRDYFQLLAYMFRFDAKQGYFFYPKCFSDKSEEILWLNKGSTYEKNVIPRNNISIIKHGLDIPFDVQNFNDFIKQMKASEKLFKDKLKVMMQKI